MLSENPFLLGVTMEIPCFRNAGYACARTRLEVLSIRMARPEAEERYVAISSGRNASTVVTEGAAAAVSQSRNGIGGEYDGVGANRVFDERESRTSRGAFGIFASCSSNAVPTPPTPVFSPSVRVPGNANSWGRTDNAEIDWATHGVRVLVDAHTMGLTNGEAWKWKCDSNI